MEMHVPPAILEVRHVPTRQPLATGMALSFSPQLSVQYDKEARAIWSRWAPEPRPCFNPALLADIRAYYEFLAASQARIDCYGEEHDIEYVVLASAKHGVFNLGGDLDLFKQLIDVRDRQGLLRDISEVFTKEKMNVIGVQTQSVKGTAWMTFTVEVADSGRLHKVLGTVSDLSGVRSARRR